jgi:FtsH-binding integral membrane protein
MSDFDRNYAAPSRGVGADRAIAIDQGLRAYMIRVYNYMAMGVALTGVVAWLTFNAAVTETAGRLALTPFGQMIYSGPATIVLFLGTLGLVFLISWRIDRLQPSTAFALFMVYAAALGLMLSSIFLAYTGASITRVFFISAASFGALSLYGYTTQRDLSPIGSFLIMGLIGLIIAMVVNMFLKSTGLDFVISAAGVLIFAGLTAWDTQKIKEMFDPQEDGTVVGRKAVMGALTLYLDFINLFLFMLRFFGDRR